MIPIFPFHGHFHVFWAKLETPISLGLLSSCCGCGCDSGIAHSWYHSFVFGLLNTFLYCIWSLLYINLSVSLFCIYYFIHNDLKCKISFLLLLLSCMYCVLNIDNFAGTLFMSESESAPITYCIDIEETRLSTVGERLDLFFVVCKMCLVCFKMHWHLNV